MKRIHVTPDVAADLRRGDIVTDLRGKRYYAWSARFGRLDVMPLENGRPVVHNESAIRFALDEVTREANPEWRSERLYISQSV